MLYHPAQSAATQHMNDDYWGKSLKNKLPTQKKSKNTSISFNFKNMFLFCHDVSDKSLTKLHADKGLAQMIEPVKQRTCC